MTFEVKSIEKEAHRLLDEQKYEEAVELLYRAAASYKKLNKHHESALCYASAAGSWTLKSGEQTFYRACLDYERAAKEAELSGDLEYAALLYKHAAVYYERDKDYNSFSDCYYKSKEYYRKYLRNSLFFFRKNRYGKPPKKSFRDILKRLTRWLTLTFSAYLWGHGERPYRTILFGVGFIFFCSCLYTQGYLIAGNSIFRPSLFQALYFSVVTFTTIGYGDMVPIGLSKGIVMIESFSGLFFIPIFITGLCRKYLRF